VTGKQEVIRAFQETQAGHSQFDAYAPIKRHFRMVTSVRKHTRNYGLLTVHELFPIVTKAFLLVPSVPRVFS
jgi:hypothetical protein